MWLACTFSPKAPVLVKWSSNLGENLGLCELQQHNVTKAYRWRVSLREGINLQVAVDTLMHEWAHALTISGMLDAEDVHSERFYSVFGQIERAWFAGGKTAASRLEL